jgi:hypothetical protein
MNKWILLAASSFIMMNAHAKDQMYCNYKDYFHLSEQSHPRIFVLQGYSEQDVLLELVGPRSFIIRDSFYCRAGYAHVTVALDQANWCVLEILDGPYMNHPTVTSSCNGLRYVNTTYDGLGSYSYSININ